MDCERALETLDPYVDGELESVAVIATERHLDACSECRAELASIRLLKHAVRERLVGPPAPAGLEQRLLLALDAEDAKQQPRLLGRGPSSWAAILAVAAGVALALASALGPIGVGELAAGGYGDRSLATQAGVAGHGAVDVLSDIVRRHTDGLPDDIVGDTPERVAPWFSGKLGFRVQPVDFGQPQVRFAGARVSHVGDQQAAKLQYDVGEGRLTLLVFPAQPSIREALSAHAGRHERVGSRTVTYHNVQGYTVPIVEHDGVVYAFTGDLDRQQLLRLAASAQVR
ncbi:MAG: zf-HC2 domain-containing protein [Myxococcales bacterium]|nr:zf-HC2 domain-containing protein [Myxococcales bacterium]